MNKHKILKTKTKKKTNKQLYEYFMRQTKKIAHDLSIAMNGKPDVRS